MVEQSLRAVPDGQVDVTAPVWSGSPPQAGDEGLRIPDAVVMLAPRGIVYDLAGVLRG